MYLCTHTLWKLPKWELENSNTVSFSHQSQGLERGCQDGGQGMARRGERGAGGEPLRGSQSSPSSSATDPPPADRENQSTLNEAMGNQHPDAGPGQASASAWGAPGAAAGTTRSGPPLDLALVSVPARLSALLVPEDLTALGRTWWSQRPRSHSGPGHKGRNAPRGLRTRRASPPGSAQAGWAHAGAGLRSWPRGWERLTESGRKPRQLVCATQLFAE